MSFHYKHRQMSLINWLKKIRFGEVVLMTGFPMSAWLFHLTTQTTLANITLAWFGIFTLFQSIYLQNSYLGKREDAINKRITQIQVYEYRIINYFSWVLLFIFSIVGLLLYPNNHLYLPLGIVSYILWQAYSFPKRGLKYRAFTGTAIHFISQIIHFFMIWGIIAPWNNYAWLYAIYTALLFSAGHLNHEMIDFKADRKANIKNTATTFGIYYSFILYIIILALSLTTIIIGLLLIGTDSYFPLYVFAIASTIHIVFSLSQFILKKYKRPNFMFYQRFVYRSIYLIAGLIIFMSYIIL